jgi:hypothetical protein
LAVSIGIRAASFQNPDPATGVAGRFQLPERPSAAVAAKVPQFGGMYIGPDQALHFYVLDTSPQVVAAAEAVIREVLGAARTPRMGFRPVKGKYTFTQLNEWHQRHRLVTLSVPGVVMTSIKESQNRLLVGIMDASVAGSVERALKGTGVPLEAVSIEVRKASRFAAETLLDKVRPLVGGLQIDGNCTMGVLAVRQGVAGFLTASHCTNIQGGIEGTVVYQPFDIGDFGDSRQIGVEIADPPYTAADCPSGRVCRYSDTAFIARSSAPFQIAPLANADFGYIANAHPI